MEGGIRESWDKSEVCQEDQWRIQQGSAGHFHSPCSLHGSHWSLCQEGASISLGPSTMSRATGDPDGHLAWKRSNFCCYKTWSILLLLQQSLAHPDEYTVATWEWESGEKKERDCVVGDLSMFVRLREKSWGKGETEDVREGVVGWPWLWGDQGQAHWTYGQHAWLWKICDRRHQHIFFFWPNKSRLEKATEDWWSRICRRWFIVRPSVTSRGMKKHLSAPALSSIKQE